MDCALLLEPGVSRDYAAVRELRKGLPFLEIALADPGDFAELVNVIFAANRAGAAKGMVEVIRWT